MTRYRLLRIPRKLLRFSQTRFQCEIRYTRRSNGMAVVAAGIHASGHGHVETAAGCTEYAWPQGLVDGARYSVPQRKLLLTEKYELTQRHAWSTSYRVRAL